MISRWLTLLLFLPLCLLAQSEDQQLADQYFAQGKFIEAEELYQKLYNKQPQRFFLDKLVATQLAMSQPEAAKKTLERHLRKSNENPSHALIQLGNVALLLNKPEAAEKEFKAAIKEVANNPNLVYQVANDFQQINQPSWALQTYQVAEARNPAFNFHYAKAILYGELGNIEQVYAEFFNLLEIQPNMLQTVQSYMAQWISEDPESATNTFVKETLIEKLQQTDPNPIYEDLLIWVFVQEQNFTGALAQLKALHKRGSNQQATIYNLGVVSLNNANYSTANRCFQFVVDQGPAEPFYLEAKNGLLRSRFLELEHSITATKEDWTQLANNYAKAIAEVGIYRESAEWMRNLAHLMAYQLNDLDSAQNLLDREIEIPNLPTQEWAQAWIAQGDLLVYRQEYYSAILAYARVEKELETEPLGQEAKFRRAKVAYFQGDFPWAKALFDGLKASTSKLMANDALRYAVLIQDNVGLDTSEVAMQIFARADLLHFQKRYTACWTLLDSLEQHFPGHSLADEILYKRAEIQTAKGEFAAAAKSWETLYQYHGTDILGDDALFYQAQLQEKQLNNLAKAQTLYEQLLLNHGDSIFAEEARKRFRLLRGDTTGS